MVATEMERVNNIISILKSKGDGALVSGKELYTTLGLKPATFYMTASKMKAMYPGRFVSYGNAKNASVTVRGKGRPAMGYRWIEEAPVMESKEAVEKKEPVVEKKEASIFAERAEAKKEVKPMPERYRDNRTDEGYYDPTAYQAMLTWQTDDAIVAKKGDIWQTENSDGTASFVAVITANKNRITCVPFYHAYLDAKEYERGNLLRINVSGKEVYVNVSSITTRPFKYFVKKIGEFSETSFGVLRGYVAMQLGLDSVCYMDRPVEVTKEIKVPVEMPGTYKAEEVDELIEQARMEAADEMKKALMRTLDSELEAAKAEGIDIGRNEAREEAKKELKEKLAECEQMYKSKLEQARIDGLDEKIVREKLEKARLEGLEAGRREGRIETEARIYRDVAEKLLKRG